MKISVIVPVYNTKKYLRQCVESILTQTYGNVEVVLVDDGSTDGSQQICDELAYMNRNVRVVHQENQGASVARNSGLLHAQGDYIHFVDSDDLLNGKDVYTTLMNFIEKERPEIVFSRRVRFEDGCENIEAIQPEYNVKGKFEGDVLKHVIQNQYQLTLTCPVNKLFKRTFLLENELYFKEGLHHEEDEWLPRVIACAQCVWFDDELLYKVRRRKGSLSEIVSDQNRADKACSKMHIAFTGMQYMQAKRLEQDTMRLVAAHYWSYMIDACLSVYRIESKKLRKKVIKYIKKSKDYFWCYKFLNNRSWRIMGWMFIHLGVKFTIKVIALRYKV